MAGNSSMRAGGIHWAATLDAKGFETGARKVRAEAAAIGDGLKNTLGRRSFLKEFSEVLGGGGSIVGVAAFSSVLADVAKNAAELRRQFSDNEITATQFKSRLVELVPVLGNIAKAGREIGESLAVAFDPNVLKYENLAKKIEEQGKARADAFKRLDAFRNETKQIGMTPDQIKHLTGNAELFAINEALQKNAGGMNPDVLSGMVFDAWQDRVTKELQQIDEQNKKLEKEFNAAAERVDAEIRKQVVIGVNDPLTQNILDYTKQQKRIAEARRDSLIGRAQGLSARSKTRRAARSARSRAAARRRCR